MMNPYVESSLTTSLENSRNSLRRIARNDDTEFSHQSVLNVMERFVKSVNTMDETILVPCRLMDLKVGDDNDPIRPTKVSSGGKSTTTPTTNNNNNNSNNNVNKKKSKNGAATVHELLNSCDLFQIYNMLNTVKGDLLWGGQQQQQQQQQQPQQDNETATTTTVATTSPKGHVRRPSTVSVASTNSSASTISDSDSDAGNENDSGIEENHQELLQNSSDVVANNFRTHLNGLTQSLRQMTDVAQYLTSRYQHDIGGSV